MERVGIPPEADAIVALARGGIQTDMSQTFVDKHDWPVTCAGDEQDEGACCFSGPGGFDFCLVLTEGQCDAFGGAYQGADTTCEQDTYMRFYINLSKYTTHPIALSTWRIPYEHADPSPGNLGRVRLDHCNS